MNEKLQYASMLEMPVTSCNVTYKPIKKKKIKKKKDLSPEQVKQELLDKVNSSAEVPETPYALEECSESANPLVSVEEVPSEETPSAAITKKTKKPFKFSVISLQLAMVVVLIGIIAVTNVLNANSGINVFMRSLFSPTQTVEADLREFNEFTPVIAMGNDVTLLESGVLSANGEGSIYSPCDGVVSSVTQTNDGSYTVKIAHSENFSTLISGLTYVYMGQGENVYSNIPVGYMEDFSASLCFLGTDGAVITGYEVVDGAVVWAV